MKKIKNLVITLLSLAVLPGIVSAGSWWEDIKLKGDFRYRHEMIDKENEDTRHRQRIRARLTVDAEVSPEIKVRLQLATGSDNPVSSNQTLNEGFSRKNVMLDLAYFSFESNAVPGLLIKGGKFGNPFFKPGKSELLWDSDLNPEGGVAIFSTDFQDISLTLIQAGLWIEERSSDDDSWMVATQGLLRFNFNQKKSSVAGGGSFFNYVNTAGFRPFFDTDNPFGNTIDLLGHYANDYNLLELFGEFSHELKSIPILVMGDYATNTAADSLKNGWLAGVHIGKITEPGSWAFRYNYRDVDKDAAVGIFTDSDFRGGGTDARGHEVGGDIQLAQNTTFKVTYFINKIDISENESDFSLLQVDLQLKFK